MGNLRNITQFQDCWLKYKTIRPDGYKSVIMRPRSQVWIPLGPFTFCRKMSILLLQTMPQTMVSHLKNVGYWHMRDIEKSKLSSVSLLEKQFQVTE